jgi:DNA-binding IclR family transcriptional regulator
VPADLGGDVELSDYPCESLTFSGLGATGSSPQAAATRLATALNNWVARNRGRRLLQVTAVAVPAGDEAGLAALLVHTAGTELTGQLADEVAAVVDDALEQAEGAESRAPAEGTAPARQSAEASGFGQG